MLFYYIVVIFEFKNKIMSELQQLEQQYLQAKSAYYNGNPIMSDNDFDNLEEYLKSNGSSVVNIVGSGVNSRSVKIKHRIPMLSLDKIRTRQNQNLNEIYEEILNWVANKSVELGVDKNLSIQITPKFDGSSCRITYKDGKLLHAVTRGDGTEGVDITEKIKLIVPNTIPFGIDIEVTGEVIIRNSVFNNKYANNYKNPRNFVAGILGRDMKLSTDKDINNTLETLDMVKDFSFIPFDVEVISELEDNVKSFVESVGFIYNHLCGDNFKWTGEISYETLKTLEAFGTDSMYKKYLYYRKNSDYLCDGFVMKIENKDYRNRLGETSHHPNWAIAVKFESTEVTTKILRYEWTIGTTGKMSPVAILEPVDFDGSVVSRASLYNYSSIHNMYAYPDSVVSLIKSGDIIPRILKVVTQSPKTQYYIDNPTKVVTDYVDFSSNDLLYTSKDVMYVGDNNDIDIRKLSKGIDILGLVNIGSANAEKLYNAGIKNIVDLFDPNKNDPWELVLSGEFKNGKALNIITDSISSMRAIELDKLIHALQINGCGASMSVQLAKYFSNVTYDFSGLEKAVISDLTDKNSENHKYIMDSINKIKQFGINILYIKPLSDDIKTFEMTGTPPRIGNMIKKEDYAKFFKQFNLKHTTLTKETNYLLTDSYDSKSTKMKKAEKNGTVIYTYEDFYNLITGNGHE